MAASFPDHLLEQASLLAGTDPRRPRQSNLRRAASAAYYALFHFLVDQACRSMAGAAAGRAPLRNILARGFEHGPMKEASKSFASGTLPLWMTHTAPQLAISADLRRITATFVRLQEQRHRADYDLSVAFSRLEVEVLVADARKAIDLWPTVAPDDAARLYLTGLLCWKTLRQR
jgi:hypothetical protein